MERITFRIDSTEFNIINDLGTRTIAPDLHVDFTEGSSMRIWDEGDEIGVKIPLNIKSGIYDLCLRIRTGGGLDTIASKTSMIGQYEVSVNGEIKPFVLDESTLVKSATYGGSHWGCIMIKGVQMKGGDLVNIKAKGMWGGLDYLEYIATSLDPEVQPGITLDQIKEATGATGSTLEEIILALRTKVTTEAKAQRDLEIKAAITSAMGNIFI